MLMKKKIYMVKMPKRIIFLRIIYGACLGVSLAIGITFYAKSSDLTAFVNQISLYLSLECFNSYSIN